MIFCIMEVLNIPETPYAHLHPLPPPKQKIGLIL
jgi:hypothetical protein